VVSMKVVGLQLVQVRRVSMKVVGLQLVQVRVGEHEGVGLQLVQVREWVSMKVVGCSWCR